MAPFYNGRGFALAIFLARCCCAEASAIGPHEVLATECELQDGSRERSTILRTEIRGVSVWFFLAILFAARIFAMAHVSREADSAKDKNAQRNRKVPVKIHKTISRNRDGRASYDRSGLIPASADFTRLL
jgi:hypothetical protein